MQLGSDKLYGFSESTSFWSGLASGLNPAQGTQTNIPATTASGTGASIGSALGGLLNITVPALLDRYLYGEQPRPPGQVSTSTYFQSGIPIPTGQVQYVTGPDGRLIPIPAGSTISTAKPPINPMLLLGGAAILLFFLMKK